MSEPFQGFARIHATRHSDEPRLWSDDVREQYRGTSAEDRARADARRLAERLQTTIYVDWLPARRAFVVWEHFPGETGFGQGDDVDLRRFGRRMEWSTGPLRSAARGMHGSRRQRIKHRRNPGLIVPESDAPSVLRNVRLARDPGVDQDEPSAFDYESTGWRLLTWDTGRRAPGRFGHRWIGAALYEPGEAEPLFARDDIGISALHGGTLADDDVLREVMAWFTLDPEGVEEDFFRDYTPRQMEFARSADRDELQMWGMECNPSDRESMRDCEYYVFLDEDDYPDLE